MDSQYEVWLEQSRELHADPASEYKFQIVKVTSPEFKTSGTNSATFFSVLLTQ